LTRGQAGIASPADIRAFGDWLLRRANVAGINVSRTIEFRLEITRSMKDSQNPGPVRRRAIEDHDGSESRHVPPPRTRRLRSVRRALATDVRRGRQRSKILPQRRLEPDRRLEVALGQVALERIQIA